MLVPNMPSIQQTEWFACSQNVQPISKSIFVYNKYIAAPSKSVYLLSHYYYSPFAIAFLKKERRIVSKTHQYYVVPTLIGHFFRLKTNTTTSSDDDLPSIEFV